MDAQPLLAAPSAPSHHSGSSGCRLKCSGNLILLVCNVLVQLTYQSVLYGFVAIVSVREEVEFGVVISVIAGGYALFGLLQILHPLGGLIADVRYGRYKVIKLSLVNSWLGYSFLSVFYVVFTINFNQDSYVLSVTEEAAAVFVIILFVLGIGGFESNVVQFCLDQLLDASSEELSLFLHWFVWMGQIGELTPRLLFTAATCNVVTRHYAGYTSFLPLALSSACLTLFCCKRRWFNCENIVGHPYRNMYRVLKFTAKHGKPLGHRSALTYSDDVRPSRIDFAKQKFGGIFTTEVVEDVKTFLRILLMLLAITPMFYFEVSTSYLFPIYGLHLGKNVSVNIGCTYKWMLFESGNLTNIISVVAIPLYILLVYPHIKRCVPRIIYRMGIGITMKVTVLIIMFIIQVVANCKSSQNTCIFLSEYRVNQHYALSPTLEFPTQVLVVVNILNGVASPLINITVLEFISAQSPHTMKGLLLGVFYAFRGLFITLGCVATFPFAQEKLWGDHHGIFDCGFYYYLSNSVLGVISQVVFLMAARQYRNRERDDTPYSHQYAEDYYSRYASRPPTRLLEEEVDNYGSIG